MKAHLNLAGGKLTFELTAETPKDLFGQIGAVQEVFEAETECGCCAGTDLRFRMREVDTFKYYEMHCGNPACRARFAFGQSKDMKSLFPKRKDDDNEWLPNRGWAKYTPKGEGAANAAPVSAGRPATPSATTAGVPTFADWDSAEQSKHWGAPWINVEGLMYKKDPKGQYVEQQSAAKAAK